MSGSSTNYDYINSTGVIVPDTTDLLSTVEGEWTDVFGPALETDASTPQGVMIVAENIARSNVIKNNALLANQINPNQAGGIFLDAIAAFTALIRSSDTYSLYTGVILAGQPTTPVPVGTQAKTTNGDIYATTTAVTIGSGGTVTVNMQAVVAGPIAAPSGTLSLFSSVLGLETITAPNAGALGVLGQSDVSFRALRRKTLALQGVALSEAMKSAINALPGVIGCQYLENIGAAATIDTISMVATSIWVCVDGGTPAQIAATILANKSQGSNWNGSQSVAVVDPSSGQSYNVLYEIPTLIPFLIRATVRQGTFVGALSSAVTNAIIAFSTNTVAANTPTDLGIVGFQVGQNVSPFEIAAAIQAQVPGCNIKTIEVATVASAVYQTTEWELNINQKASVTIGAIDVVVTT